MKILIILSLLAFSTNGFARDLEAGISDELFEMALEHNKRLSLTETSILRNNSGITTFSEWEETGYLIFSDENRYDSERIKRQLVENLPPEIKLIVYTQDFRESYHQDLHDYYSRMLSSDRVIVLPLPRGGRTSFWTRDNTPIAVSDLSGNQLFVDARYYYNFEPDESFSFLFDLELLTNSYFFEGGNLVNNSLGDCIVVNRNRRYPFGTSDTAAIPDAVFESNYGCSNLIRLEHLKGIGHADEVVKFLDDHTVVTDTEEYVEIFESAGFDVHLLPEPRTEFGTYANSIIIQDVVYVPVYDEPTDQEALGIYEDLLPGYLIVPIESSELSANGQGGIHCITMTYPPYELVNVAEALK